MQIEVLIMRYIDSKLKAVHSKRTAFEGRPINVQAILFRGEGNPFELSLLCPNCI
jgi:hypothetical protein